MFALVIEPARILPVFCYISTKECDGIISMNCQELDFVLRGFVEVAFIGLAEMYFVPRVCALLWSTFFMCC